MVLTEKTYSELKQLIEQEKTEDLKNYLDRLHREMTYDLTRLCLSYQEEEVEKELLRFRYVKKSLAGMIRDALSYQIGVLDGIVSAISLVAKFMFRDKAFQTKLEGLYRCENVQKILWYLKKNPYSQHKEIAEKLGIRPNYLSELMRKLEKANAVLQYRTGRNTFYELTLEGQSFMKQKKEPDTIEDFTRALILFDLQEKTKPRPYEMHRGSFDLEYCNHIKMQINGEERGEEVAVLG